MICEARPDPNSNQIHISQNEHRTPKHRNTSEAHVHFIQFNFLLRRKFERMNERCGLKLRLKPIDTKNIVELFCNKTLLYICRPRIFLFFFLSLSFAVLLGSSPIPFAALRFNATNPIRRRINLQNKEQQRKGVSLPLGCQRGRQTVESGELLCFHSARWWRGRRVCVFHYKIDKQHTTENALKHCQADSWCVPAVRACVCVCWCWCSVGGRG